MQINMSPDVREKVEMDNDLIWITKASLGASPCTVWIFELFEIVMDFTVIYSAPNLIFDILQSKSCCCLPRRCHKDTIFYTAAVFMIQQKDNAALDII